jgi:integrase
VALPRPASLRPKLTIMPKTPTLENGTVARSCPTPPRRVPYRERRAREYLTPAEVANLMKAAKARNRYGYRDATVILAAYRHGLRVSELCALRWDQLDLKQGLFHVRRAKKGIPSTHPLQGDELRALRQLRREAPFSPFVFLSERGAPVSPAGFLKMLARLGEAAGFSFPIHPHMLRHGCGYKLGNDGHDTRAIQVYLGHKRIDNTTKYTELSASRFKDFWRD